MKRGREIDPSVNTANCLMFVSQGTKVESLSSHHSDTGRVFECMTCKKQFPSFQALGGHRASHKKPKLMDGKVDQTTKMNESSTKPKSHECSICGLEFAIGQALGGHMRRHRAAALNDHERVQEDSTLCSSAAAVRKNISTKRIWLDLNLMPLENDLDFVKLEKVAHSAPLVHCFF